MMDRRGFLVSSLALPAAAAPGSASAPGELAGNLARLVFLDDVASLAALSPKVPGATAAAVAGRREFFIAGALLDPAAVPDAGSALAVRAGRVARQAYEPLHPAGAAQRLQWDARLLRELALREGLAPDADAVAEDIAGLFDTLSRRVLIAIHTYIPDDADVEGWMERLIVLHEAARAYWARLGSAFRAARAGQDGRFDGGEPWIRAAAALRHEPLDAAAVAGALASEPRSAYARALARAHAGIAGL